MQVFIAQAAPLPGNGFVLANASVEVGKSLTRAAAHEVDRPCATHRVLVDYRVKEPLPLNETAQATFTPQKLGNIQFAHPADMIGRDLEAE